MRLRFFTRGTSSIPIGQPRSRTANVGILERFTRASTPRRSVPRSLSAWSQNALWWRMRTPSSTSSLASFSWSRREEGSDKLTDPSLAWEEAIERSSEHSRTFGSSDLIALRICQRFIDAARSARSARSGAAARVAGCSDHRRANSRGVERASFISKCRIPLPLPSGAAAKREEALPLVVCLRAPGARYHGWRVCLAARSRQKPIANPPRDVPISGFSRCWPARSPTEA